MPVLCPLNLYIDCTHISWRLRRECKFWAGLVAWSSLSRLSSNWLKRCSVGVWGLYANKGTEGCDIWRCHRSMDSDLLIHAVLLENCTGWHSTFVALETDLTPVSCLPSMLLMSPCENNRWATTRTLKAAQRYQQLSRIIFVERTE